MVKKTIISRIQYGSANLRRFSRGVGFLLIAIALPARADTSGVLLSASDAVRIGLNRPAIVQQLKSRLDLAESDIVEARTWANPEFSFELETSDDGPEDITERTYGLSQEFSISGRRSIQAKAAVQRRKAESLAIEHWRLNKTAEIRQLFYNVLYQQERMAVYAQMRLAMDDLETVMQERKDAGDISGYDLARLQQERSLLMAEQGHALAEKQRGTQEFLTHLGLADKTATWPGVTDTLLPQSSLKPLERLLEQAENQPDLKAIKLQTDAFASDERLARRSWIPDPTLGLGYKNTDEADGDAFIFGISLPIPVFDRNPASQQRALANRKHLQSEYALALAEKKGTIRGLWYQDRELSDAINLLDCEECKALLETANIAYQAGEIGVLEILDAHRSTFEHQMQVLTLMKEARMVRTELEMNTGGNIQ